MWCLCHVFENPLYLSGDLMADSAVPSDLSVPKVPETDRAATSAHAKGYSLFVLQEHGGKPKGSFPLHHLVSDSAWACKAVFPGPQVKTNILSNFHCFLVSQNFIF